MKALIINGHVPYEYAKGDLNAELVCLAGVALDNAGFSVETTIAHSDYDIDAEIAKIIAADIVIVQFPLYNMSVPWVLKKYMDDVFLAGGDGRLYSGDGRSRKDPSKTYGSGGVLNGKPYMFSVTANAPSEAFDDESQPFFEGLSVSELLTPVHLAFQFNGMMPLEVFTAHDVHKNPDIETDFMRFNMHLLSIIKNRFS